MKINPILDKELKLSARTIRMPIILMVYNLVLSCVAILSLSAIRNQYENGFSMRYQELLVIFQILGWIQCVLVCFMVPVLTASSIAGEREKQTLDIMLTTAVRPIQIVIGKLLASLCTTCILVISSIPILSVAFIFGGMDWKNILYFILIIICIAIFVGSVGIFFSCVFKRTPVAIVLTFIFGFLLVIGTVFGMPFVKMFVEMNSNIYAQTYTMNIEWSSLFMLLNPIVLFLEFMESSMGGRGIVILLSLFEINENGWFYSWAEQWWIPVSILVHLVVSALFLFGASWFLNPLNQKHKIRKNKVKKKR